MNYLRNKPTLAYNGITLVLSNPSRFDKLRLLTATGGVLFNSLLQPEFNQMGCDVRVADDKSELLLGTKVVILLGAYAMHSWCPDTRENTLLELRGSPLYVNGNIPAIATFFPQDAADIKNYEATSNEANKNRAETFNDESDEEDDEDGDAKTLSSTKRANYAFWMAADIKKAKLLLRSGSNKWEIEKEPVYRIYPPAQEVINVLRSHENEYLYFDMETDYEEQNLLCFSFSFDSRCVYSVPVLNHEYHWSYSALPQIIRALAVAISKNTLVAHNGAGFDFVVLGAKYHIPVVSVYDTMVAHHRCFPDVEQSLGHCTSYWTNQRFHKDSDSFAYRTSEHLMQKLKYCAKDVFTMALIHEAIEKYAKTIPGLVDSISLANRSIRPYLTTTIQGIRYSEEQVKKICDENDRLLTQYVRIINILIGEAGLAECRKAVKGKAKGLPGSNSQCVSYFHDQLGYPVIWRSPKTQKPALGKKQMYKLALKHDNPVIKFIMMYRGVQKELGALKFCPWKGDDGKITNYKQWKAIQDA